MRNYYTATIFLLLSLFTNLSYGLQSTVNIQSSLETPYTSSENSIIHYASDGYGEISPVTGRAKTVHVKGYYRKDGTYVQSHYRSPPKRK